MMDFIKAASDFFDAIIEFVSHTLEQIAALMTALSHISTGLTESITFFPSFLGGIMLSSFCLIVLLRILGR